MNGFTLEQQEKIRTTGRSGYLDGEFFHTGYHHLGCDNELTGRCQLIGKYVWAKDAVIKHNHPAAGAKPDWVHDLAWSRATEDRALLKQRAEALGFTHLLV